jgi:hypothetical protein
MRSYYFGILFIVSSFSVAAQSQSSAFFVNDLNLKSSSSQIEVTPKGDTIMVAYFEGNDVLNQSTRGGSKKYIGTPFYGNRWLPGTASMNATDESKGMMAFNVVKNVISYSPDNETKPIDIAPFKFILNGVEFRKLNLEVPKAGPYYYTVLQEGEIQLVRQYAGKYVPIVEREEKAYTNTKEKEYEGKFVKETSDYLIIGSELIPVEKKAKLLKNLGSLSNKAEAIIKSEKIDLDKTEDLIKFTKSLNSK